MDIDRAGEAHFVIDNLGINTCSVINYCDLYITAVSYYIVVKLKTNATWNFSLVKSNKTVQ